MRARRARLSSAAKPAIRACPPGSRRGATRLVWKFGERMYCRGVDAAQGFVLESPRPTRHEGGSVAIGHWFTLGERK
jgi:hypothetical protein